MRNSVPALGPSKNRLENRDLQPGVPARQDSFDPQASRTGGDQIEADYSTREKVGRSLDKCLTKEDIKLGDGTLTSVVIVDLHSALESSLVFAFGWVSPQLTLT
ncbi:hypothetical protein STEG23_024135 [Scotinomys teguina]